MYSIDLVRSAAHFALAAAFAIGSAAPVAAQGLTVSGRLFHSVTLKPVAGATVLVEGTKLETKSAADGTYTIAGVPPGTYHLLIVAPGFIPSRADFSVGSTAVSLDVAVDPELHYTEVVSVSPDARNQFEAYQPTTVLTGQDLSKQLQDIGRDARQSAGRRRAFVRPGPSRPVIRGLDGDRVMILEDGQRVGDLSSQSGDHGVTVNPAASTRIEVVRGPATLLYGANAIGGLVNVISDAIPTGASSGTHGGLTLRLRSAATEAGGAADLKWGNGTGGPSTHPAAGAGQATSTRPEGKTANTQSRGGFGRSASHWTGERAYFGGSYGYDDTKYGIPFVEEGQIQLTPRRHMIGLRAGAEGLNGPFESVRALFGYRQYRHEELEGDEVGTRFENDTADINVQAKHRPWGRLTGTVGTVLPRA